MGNGFFGFWADTGDISGTITNVVMGNFLFGFVTLIGYISGTITNITMGDIGDGPSIAIYSGFYGRAGISGTISNITMGDSDVPFTGYGGISGTITNVIVGNCNDYVFLPQTVVSQEQ
jgi:hypothetical protein